MRLFHLVRFCAFSALVAVKKCDNNVTFEEFFIPFFAVKPVKNSSISKNYSTLGCKYCIYSTYYLRCLEIVKWNLLPLPRELSTQILPPCLCTNSLQIRSPRPVPFSPDVPSKLWRVSH